MKSVIHFLGYFFSGAGVAAFAILLGLPASLSLLIYFTWAAAIAWAQEDSR